ncbi:hypothetical protein BDY19DRAFT_400901 [Irpex rosettiformis]|uniref:Uncharacterized protein n=1 Tax=Irpex rosettiformis TaxID=378272 RepID=A0ACB8UF53_9APHY|nr:hypothetical protein BDY19DRAFT_400901 [Irpex rosettiformis]
MMLINEVAPFSPVEAVVMTVPYERYTSKRKQYGWRQKSTVYFRTETSEGIPLLDALHGNVHNLLDRHEAILTGCGDKVSYHIHMHGYIPLRCQKYSYYQKHGEKFANTRAKVARQIAEAVQDFIDKRQYEEHAEDWRVGPGYIELKHLYLLELRHVASGCFQPILGVLRPTHRVPGPYIPSICLCPITAKFTCVKYR